MYLTSILFFVAIARALDRTGPFNQFSKVPFYEGPRIEDWDSKSVILLDEPSNFYWNYKINVDDRNNLWVADSKNSMIYFISKEVETWNAIFRVSGGRPGMRDGNIAAALFNSPESIAVYTLNETKSEMSRSLKPIWLANLTSEACRNSDQTNYTACGVIIDKDFPYDIIDHKRVKYIPFGNF